MLGAEHAIALAEVGATVIVTDVDDKALAKVVARLTKECGSGRIVAKLMDVTDSTQIANVARELDGRSGVDILINNAAIDPKVRSDNSVQEMSRFEHFPADQWAFQISIGLTGAFLCSQEFGARMAAKGCGVILNIASDLSVIAPDQRIYRCPGVPDDQQPVKPVTYSVIKAGLVGLTRYLATYWADKNVRVNALSPGGVYNQQSKEFVRKLTHLIPLGRMARRDEYHGAIQFLCSDASSYLTGQNIVMDGGRSVW